MSIMHAGLFYKGDVVRWLFMHTGDWCLVHASVNIVMTGLVNKDWVRQVVILYSLRFIWHGTWFANHAQKQDNEDGEESHL